MGAALGAVGMVGGAVAGIAGAAMAVRDQGRINRDKANYILYNYSQDKKRTARSMGRRESQGRRSAGQRVAAYGGAGVAQTSATAQATLSDSYGNLASDLNTMRFEWKNLETDYKLRYKMQRDAAKAERRAGIASAVGQAFGG